MLTNARKARGFFPLATRKQRVRQAVAYAKAVEYLRSKNLEAVAIGSKFEYVRATGSILS